MQNVVFLKKKLNRAACGFRPFLTEWKFMENFIQKKIINEKPVFPNFVLLGFKLYVSFENKLSTKRLTYNLVSKIWNKKP